MPDDLTTSRPHSRAGALKPSAWTVVANVSYQNDEGVYGSHQVPTFSLPLPLGLCTPDTAKRTAKAVIDPMGHMITGSKARLPHRDETLVYIDVIREDAPLPRRNG